MIDPNTKLDTLTDDQKRYRVAITGNGRFTFHFGYGPTAKDATATARLARKRDGYTGRATVFSVEILTERGYEDVE